ncbi:SDR family oxidoreductase [Dickeya chrysanthemi]|uniref:SDR family oxidoreductase n=1 Tax=Dickeya chrysanthemi TaxID=556 RepID=UPI00039ABC19|nr:SDR family oxidoreductase [Dickeya chrysanthemi]MBX9446557.1 SDR family oxidoreductase [Dickeya chrysanthemi]
MQNITLITGGSRGIGRATALRLARQGHWIAISYLRQYHQAQRVVEEITALGGKAIAIQADVADEQQIVALFANIDRELGPLSGLVNNAGILHPQARFEELDAARLNAMFAANITGCFLCAREAIKRMSHRHGGRGGAIVNVSSAASRLGAPHEYVDYAASKGALDSMTKGLSLEVAAEGIRVNAVRPGFIYTDIHADGGEPGRVDRLSQAIPMQRGGQPEEVANAIAWLLSDEASYVTGSFIDLAGGK